MIFSDYSTVQVKVDKHIDVLWTWSCHWHCAFDFHLLVKLRAKICIILSCVIELGLFARMTSIGTECLLWIFN